MINRTLSPSVPNTRVDGSLLLVTDIAEVQVWQGTVDTPKNSLVVAAPFSSFPQIVEVDETQGGLFVALVVDTQGQSSETSAQVAPQAAPSAPSLTVI